MHKPTKQKVPANLIRTLRGRSEDERLLHRLHGVVLVLNGFSCSEVARLYGDSARNVAYWVKRFEENGVSGLEERKPSGRPSKLTLAQLKKVRAFVEQHSKRKLPVTGEALSSFINQKFGIQLTIRQCRRISNTLRESR